ncbi:MAG: pyrroloquinoline quinone biosynthesis peptide chaperone PqqD [Janthinobacterium lividum]
MSVPRFNRGFRLRRDDVRGSWIVLAPERIFVLDDHAAEVLQLVDGTRSTADIVDVLAAKFAAPASEIGADVEAMLQDLKSKGAIAL